MVNIPLFAFGVVLMVASGSNATGACSPACCTPGICVEPDAKFKHVLPIKPRQQWNTAGGFCGSTSLQVMMMGHGAWLSADLIRKGNIGAPCFGHNSTGDGCEVGPENYAATGKGLRLKYDVWDYTQPKPQASAFKSWLKSHLAKGSPVMWAPMEKGEFPHQPYGPESTPGGGAFDHHEPIIGIGSNHDLSDATVYDDDWVLHHSNQDLMPYYRKFSSLEDGLHMDGNCQHASTVYPAKEAYPCFYDQVVYGMAINGFDIAVPTLPVTIDVDNQQEPNTRSGEKPVELHATVTVDGLKKGQSYVLYRYAGFNSFPATDLSKGYDRKHRFVAFASSWTYKDPNPFLSSGAMYYFVSPDTTGQVVV